MTTIIPETTQKLFVFVTSIEWSNQSTLPWNSRTVEPKPSNTQKYPLWVHWRPMCHFHDLISSCFNISWNLIPLVATNNDRDGETACPCLEGNSIHCHFSFDSTNQQTPLACFLPLLLNTVSPIIQLRTVKCNGYPKHLCIVCAPRSTGHETLLHHRKAHWQNMFRMDSQTLLKPEIGSPKERERSWNTNAWAVLFFKIANTFPWSGTQQDPPSRDLSHHIPGHEDLWCSTPPPYLLPAVDLPLPPRPQCALDHKCGNSGAHVMPPPLSLWTGSTKPSSPTSPHWWPLLFTLPHYFFACLLAFFLCSF